MANRSATIRFRGGYSSTWNTAANWVAIGDSGFGVKQTLPYLDGRVALYGDQSNTPRWFLGSCVLITDVQLTGYDQYQRPIVSLSGDTIANLAPSLTFEDGFGAQETGAVGTLKEVSLTSQGGVFSFYRPKSFTIQNCIVDFAYDDKEKAFQIRKGSVEFKPSTAVMYRDGGTYLMSQFWGDPHCDSIPQNVPANSIGFHNVNAVAQVSQTNNMGAIVTCYPNYDAGDQNVDNPYHAAWGAPWFCYESSVPVLWAPAVGDNSDFGTKTVADAFDYAARAISNYIFSCGVAYSALTYPS